MWVTYLYTVVEMEPSGSRCSRTSRNGSFLTDSTGGTGGLEAGVIIKKQLKWNGKGSPPGTALKKKKLTPPYISAVYV